jgi:hypothetical protein
MRLMGGGGTTIRTSLDSGTATKKATFHILTCMCYQVLNGNRNKDGASAHCTAVGSVASSAITRIKCYHLIYPQHMAYAIPPWAPSGVLSVRDGI